MDSQQVEAQRRLVGVFMPDAVRKLADVRAAGKRFAHYSTAENIFKIISSQTVWMRNTRCMSDYSEIEHGYAMLHQFFSKSVLKDAFYRAVNAISPNLAEEAIALFDQWWQDIRFNTFVCSISEHEDSEDGHGRLSMWRAFGRSASRAAIILRLPADGAAEGLRVILSPVRYFGYADVEAELQRVVENINENLDHLLTVDREKIKYNIFMTLVMGSVCTKHIGFLEEKEWRLIYLPRANHSPLITSSIEVVDGVPQIIHKIPLHDNVENDVTGVKIPALLDKIIIGPTMYAAPMVMAFVQALTEAGVTDASSRVVVSGIPIRP